jgi:Tol biopolymer transport system component
MTPEGHILFLRDRHRDENFPTYHIRLESGEVRALTQNTELYHHSPQLTDSGRRIVYVRGSHRSTASTIVVQPIHGGDARVVTRIAGPIELSDGSDDGRVLFAKRLSLSDSTLYLIDLDSGHTRRLAPAPRGAGPRAQGRFLAG